uniref:Diacylglycerol kinase n=1 Tax=Alexandrium monilatum TaxID=311494 RepID=A0A7S4V475_9DINO
MVAAMMFCCHKPELVHDSLDMVTEENSPMTMFQDELFANELEEPRPMADARQEPEDAGAICDEPMKVPVLSPPPEPKEAPDRLTRRHPIFIVIVNPKSGGNTAGEFLALPTSGFEVDEPDGVRATVFSYAITDPSKAGFKHLAREVEAVPEGQRARCIVAGGDGTVMWTIEEMFKAGIPVNRVSLGIVPFGTGNDFANVTGWGTKGPPKDFLKEKQGFKGLEDYVRRWLRADSKSYDIWEVSLRTHKSGSLQFIDDGKKVCTDKHVQRHHIKELPEGGLEMSKYMCNYFSMGLDARIGVGFDKNRQGGQAANKAVYGWEGTKKLLFKRKGLIANITESMRLVENSKTMEKACDGHDQSSYPSGEVVFTTENSQEAEGDRLLGNPVNLIFLNIPSIAGGLDIWNWSDRNMGTNASRELLQARQDFADGKLECLAYRTGIGYVLEQVRAPPVSGRGHRVYSGGGPLRLKFKSPTDEGFIKGTSHCKGRTYMQVDGEYFIVREPDSVVIRHHCAIQVLVNAETPSGCCAR